MVAVVRVSQGREPRRRSPKPHSQQAQIGTLSLPTSKESGKQTRDEHLQTVPGLQDHGLREGRKVGSPLTPGPQRCYQPDPAENPSRIPVHSSLNPASFTASRSQDAVYGCPILQPLSPGPKGIWPGQEAGGWEGGIAPRPPLL